MRGNQVGVTGRLNRARTAKFPLLPDLCLKAISVNLWDVKGKLYSPLSRLSL